MNALREQAERTLAHDLAEIIVMRTIAGLDCPAAYLRTLGFAEATIAEHLTAAEQLARAALESTCLELQRGIRS